LVKFLPAIVVVIVGVTATALVGSIGVIALAIIWTLLVAVISLTFAAKWLRDLRILTQERDDLRSRLAEMEGRPRTDPTENGQVDALHVEVQSWKTKALENQRESRRLEAELRELQDKVALAGLGDEGRGVLLATQLTCYGPDPLPGDGAELDQGDLEPVTYDFAAKRLKRGTVIEVVAECDTRFAFFLYDETNFRRHQEHRRNTAAIAGKENVTVYREQITIPHGGEWFFLVEPQVEAEDIEVRLRVTLIREPDPN
jgi:hypothetical protein